jgi:hypothetical protein
MDKEFHSGIRNRNILVVLLVVGIFLGCVFFGKKDYSPSMSERNRNGLIVKDYSGDKDLSRVFLFASSMGRDLISWEQKGGQGGISYSWNGENYEKRMVNVTYEKEPIKNIKNKRVSRDGDNDGVSEDHALVRGYLSVKESGKQIWKSPGEWWVDDFEIADCDNDGKNEIVVSLWKSGSFGTSKPFWVKENDMSIKNHMFVYEYTDNSIRLAWGSSNLPYANEGIAFADVDNDQKNELVVIERKYVDDGIRHVAVWKWNGWGFSNEWRDEGGRYFFLEVIKGHIIVY